MPTADTGNWDLVVEIAASTVSTLLATRLTTTALPTRQVSNARFSGTVTPAFSPKGLTLAANGDVSISFSIDNTTVHVSQLNSAPPGVPNPPTPPLSEVALKGVVTVTDHLDLVANAVAIDFSASPLLGQPKIVVALQESEILASELVTLMLGYAYLLGGQTGYDTAKAQLLADVRSEVESAVQDAVTSLGTITVLPAPVLPAPLAITGSALLVQAPSFHVCYSIGGPAGNVALISRSMLLTSSLTGMPVDAGAFALSNASLLRDFVRPALIAAVGLPPGGFVPGHPCFFLGGAPLAVVGVPLARVAVSVDSVLAGIDESGLLHVLAHVSARTTDGSFSISASVDATFAVTATITGGTLTLGVTPVGTPAVSSDLSIAWWIYVYGAVTGGFGLVEILAFGDLFAGALLNGPLASGLAGALPAVTAAIPLPTSLGTLTVRSARTFEADSARRVIALLGGAITIVDPFRSHDVIVNVI